MKLKKKVYCILLIMLVISFACVCILFVTACSQSEPEDVAVETIILDKNVLTLKEAQSEKLTATVLPENATDKRVYFSLADPQYAQFISVSEDGTVTAIAVGGGIVVAKTMDGSKNAFCSVVVERPAPESIKFDKTSIILDREESEKLTATIQPAGAQGFIMFESQDTSVATVLEDGTVSAVGLGETTIRAYLSPQIYTECSVRVGYIVKLIIEGKGTVKGHDENLRFSGGLIDMSSQYDMGYMLDGWYENGEKVSKSRSYRHTITKDTTITVKFVANPDMPTVNADGYYEIKTPGNLNWATEYDSLNYILMNDFIAPEDFNGFGTFSGVFDGNYHLIENLALSSKDSKGFIVYLDGGTVKNLTLKNVDCQGEDYLGLLAARAAGATIENCRVSGTLQNPGGYSSFKMGGLVGNAFSNTVIRNCFVDVTANVTDRFGTLGGVIGTANNCEITGCAAKVYLNVHTDRNDVYAGAFVGEVDNGNLTVNDCHSYGTIRFILDGRGMYGSLYCSGFIGKFSKGTVNNCYSDVDITFNTTSASGNGIRCAGFCTYNYGTVQNSIYCGKITTYGIGPSESCYAFDDNEKECNNYITNNFSDPDVIKRGKEKIATYDDLANPNFYRENLGWTTENWIFEDGFYPYLQGNEKIEVSNS